MTRLYDMLKFRLLLALVALATAVSCSVDLSGGNDEVPTTDDGMLLSFAVPNTSNAGTKSIDAITQADGYFHGMQGIRLLPFGVKRKIESSDARIGAIPQVDALDQDTHPATNYAFVYPNFPFVPIGTSSFLFYGYAADNTGAGSDVNSAAFKLRNGSLIAEGLDSRNPANITFTPERIYTATNMPAEATDLAEKLSAIANTSYRQSFYIDHNGISSNPRYEEITIEKASDWKPDEGLLTVYKRFVNAAGNSYCLIGISGLQAAALLTDLYKSQKTRPNSSNTTKYQYLYGGSTPCDCYETQADYTAEPPRPLTYGKIQDNLRDAIVSNIENLQTSGYITIGTAPNYTIAFTSTAMQNFPRTYGLPDGAIGVRWNGINAFEVVAQGTKEAISKYCYPPRLWYYANSQIQTSTTSDNLNQYPTQASRYDRWSDILSHYTSGPTVYQDTKAVALIDPVQYGVAMLSVTLKQTASELVDAAGESVTVGATSFPLTALFVGGQRQQIFNFTPNSTADDYVSYDPEMPTVYLSTSDDTGPARTLVLQTNASEDIYIAAEFQNNSGTPFQGLDGVVIEGGKFYLLGELKFSTGASSGGQSFNSVFLQDYVTSATLSVTSLANARNVIPNMKVKQLDLGVQVTINWLQSTSTTVPMY